LSAKKYSKGLHDVLLFILLQTSTLNIPIPKELKVFPGVFFRICLKFFLSKGIGKNQ
jgi:hypothetical protein